MNVIGAWQFLSVAVILSVAAPTHADEIPPTLIEQIDELQQMLDLLVPDKVLSEATPPAADLRILVTGAQWAWSYQYGFEGDPPLDMPELVVPVDQIIRLDVTSTDVIHEFAVPAFALNVDAVPGRIASTWFNPLRVGTYFGQCSSLCGSGHAGMVISIKVVSRDDYAAWLAEQAQ